MISNSCCNTLLKSRKKIPFNPTMLMWESTYILEKKLQGQRVRMLDISNENLAVTQKIQT